MVYFNDLYRTAALQAGGEFVDVWGGFTDANGAFTASGPDMAGQTARLRNSDGITLTAAGTDKLAYFVEKPVTRILGLSVDDLVASLGAQQLSAADIPSAGDLASATTTPPVSFSDPSLDGGDRLLGGGPATTAEAATDASPRAKLVVAGAPHDPTEGRADQFNWTGRGAAVSPATRDNAIVFRGSTTLDEIRRQAKDGTEPRDGAGAADAAARSLPPPASPDASHRQETERRGRDHAVARELAEPDEDEERQRPHAEEPGHQRQRVAHHGKPAEEERRQAEAGEPPLGAREMALGDRKPARVAPVHQPAPAGPVEQAAERVAERRDQGQPDRIETAPQEQRDEKRLRAARQQRRRQEGRDEKSPLDRQGARVLREVDHQAAVRRARPPSSPGGGGAGPARYSRSAARGP